MRQSETVTGVCDEARRRPPSEPTIIVDVDLPVLADDALPSILVDRKDLLPAKRIRAKTIK